MRPRIAQSDGPDQVDSEGRTVKQSDFRQYGQGVGMDAPDAGERGGS